MIPSRELQEHPLWAGSILALDYRYMRKCRDEEVATYIRSLRRATDRTPDEESFLTILEADLAAQAGQSSK
jgi:hypothetical protein